MAIVTVSREMGSGGRECGGIAAKALGYDLLYKEKIIEHIRRRGPAWASWEQEMGESGPSLWERFDRSFIGLVALAEQSILEAAAGDRVVIVGRGGNCLLRDIPHVLHVRIIAPLDVRIEWAVKHMGLDRDAALKFVRKADQDRARYVRAVYRCDWADPLEYDVVCDSSKLSYDGVARLIECLVPGREQRVTEEARRMLARRAVTARVKADLLTSPDIFIPSLEVSHDDRAVFVKGVVKNTAERRRIEQIATAAAGDESVTFDIRFRA